MSRGVAESTHTWLEVLREPSSDGDVEVVRVSQLSRAKEQNVDIPGNLRCTLPNRKQ